MGNMRPCQDATLARCHGYGASYKMVASRMNILPLSWEHRQKVYGKLDRWPMGIVQIPGKLKPTADGSMTPTLAATLLWTPNHGQHTNEYIVPELIAAANLLELPHNIMAG